MGEWVGGEVIILGWGEREKVWVGGW
jgi:hypothetical protein